MRIFKRILLIVTAFCVITATHIAAIEIKVQVAPKGIAFTVEWSIVFDVSGVLVSAKKVLIETGKVMESISASEKNGIYTYQYVNGPVITSYDASIENGEIVAGYSSKNTNSSKISSGTIVIQNNSDTVLRKLNGGVVVSEFNLGNHSEKDGKGLFLWEQQGNVVSKPERVAITIDALKRPIVLTEQGDEGSYNVYRLSSAPELGTGTVLMLNYLFIPYELKFLLFDYGPR